MNDSSILLDSHSLKILHELQRDSRQTIQQIADTVGLSATPCWKRIKEMEASGVIRGYTVRVDREKVGLDIAVVAEVNLSPHGDTEVARFEQAVSSSPQVVHCVAATGPADYILTVLVPDIGHYEQFLREVLLRIPGLTQVRSSIVLKDIKSEGPLPIGAAPGPAARRRVRRGG